MSTLAQTYDAIAHRYDQGDGINDWIALPIIQHFCPTHTRTALEVGCGVGRIAIEMSKRVDLVWGIDISKEMIAYAQRRAQSADKPIRFVQGDALTFDFGSRMFDFVYGAYITAYFDVPTLLRRLASLTFRDGRILIVGGMGSPGSGSGKYLGQVQHYAECLRFLRRHGAPINLPRFIANVFHRVQCLGSKEWQAVEAWNRARRGENPEANWRNQFLATLPGARIEQITPKLACAIWDQS
jgi:ubiquinone/menaquinone biosynthesis C-methylase UbiE